VALRLWLDPCTINLQSCSTFVPPYTRHLKRPHASSYLLSISHSLLYVGCGRTSISILISLMRRTSVSLPTRNNHHDPYEKPARYNTRGARNSAAGTVEKIKAAWMTQSQRSRYLKTGGLLLFIVFLFYYFVPTGTGVSTRCM